MVLKCGVEEDSWESFDCKEIKLINLKDQSSINIGRTDAEAETPILWPSDAKNWLIGKDPDAGKDCRQEEKGMTEDEMVEWHHQLNRHESEQGPKDGDRQGSQVCCSPWGCKESDTAEWLNSAEALLKDKYTEMQEIRVFFFFFFIVTQLVETNWNLSSGNYPLLSMLPTKIICSFYQHLWYQWNGPIKLAYSYNVIVYAMENNKWMPHLITWMNVINITWKGEDTIFFSYP